MESFHECDIYCKERWLSLCFILPCKLYYHFLITKTCHISYLTMKTEFHNCSTAWSLSLSPKDEYFIHSITMLLPIKGIACIGFKHHKTRDNNC
ncbi:hypothetical protein Lalb_Chr24g0401751 [Lupinus albus]|uniref:Uncharacterized protein n=1 Tax=Lupinus albus TaxID=3870 RepID=A0A6A4N144_LUPAL|nr:hypothetical protein Lalb_Chr24g0401751 [Lupinus albus]